MLSDIIQYETPRRHSTQHQCEGAMIYPEGLRGEKICSKCGLVLETNLPVKSFTNWTPEWNSNWDEQDSETLKEWLTILRTISCQLNVPNFPYREEAARTLRRQKQTIFKSQKLSKDKRSTVAALMHLVLKEYNKMRPIKEISEELSLDIKTVHKHSWILQKTLQPKEEPVTNQRKTALDYLHEYGGKTTNNKDILIEAQKTLNKVKRSGGNPIGVAAGALYYTCKTKKCDITKENIGKTFRISARTVYANEARIRRLLKNP
jgi:transcription initiation factor TFIIIB Brf1 subunit/transcription initiation factor TFIIB